MVDYTFPFIEVDFSVTIWDHPAQPIFLHYSPYLPLSCPVHSHPATPKKLRLFCMLTLLLYYSKIQIFFTARKRFVVPSDEEPLRPVPVRLFPRRNEAAVAICDEDSSAAPPLVPESTCDFCLRAPCITSSDFKPRGRCSARINNHMKRRKDYKWYWKTLKDNGYGTTHVSGQRIWIGNKNWVASLTTLERLCHIAW